MDASSQHLEPNSFANLTPVCLTSVLSNLSLPDLLSCARVNQHWRSQVIDYCRMNVKSIEISTLDERYPLSPYLHHEYSHLLTNEDGSRMFPDDPLLKSLFLTQSILPVSLADTLIGFSPHLNRLDVQLETLTDDILPGLLTLLSQSRSLVSFTLCCSPQFPNGTKQDRLQSLFAVINSLAKLERLTLLFDDELGIEPELTCLSRLHELYFECRHDRDILRHTLLQYASAHDSTNLPRITYFIRHPETDQDESPMSLMLQYDDSGPGRRTARLFTLFPFGELIFHHQLPQLVPLLPSLTSLYLCLGYSNWHSSMRVLAQFPNLIYLLLDAEPRGEDESRHQEPINDSPRLPSVRVVEFRSLLLTHHDRLTELSLCHFFPRLQVLNVEYSGQYGQMCETCLEKVVSDPVRSENLEQIEKQVSLDCVRSILSEWRASPSLTHVTLNYEPVDLAEVF